VVINEGRVEQIGSPEQLYDEPANDFVMGFLGEVTTLKGVVVRPHDVEVATAPSTSDEVEGTVSRVLRVGFEVKLTVLTDLGEEVVVTMTRSHQRQLGVDEGSRVWLSVSKGAITVP
jgi:sulfate transport system ATP-binding protein